MLQCASSVIAIDAPANGSFAVWAACQGSDSKRRRAWAWVEFIVLLISADGTSILWSQRRRFTVRNPAHRVVACHVIVPSIAADAVDMVASSSSHAFAISTVSRSPPSELDVEANFCRLFVRFPASAFNAGGPPFANARFDFRHSRWKKGCFRGEEENDVEAPINTISRDSMSRRLPSPAVRMLRRFNRALARTQGIGQSLSPALLPPIALYPSSKRPSIPLAPSSLCNDAYALNAPLL
ncbi:hypothetical protein R3P38DRAFT_3224316 [Favolaschia claudopus]|uniref:Uncharacterized protein n=1 Tax=Favolaschia claudopus TaxID=2862362 RepID=A0AAV9ZVZ2_9AGAR